MFLQMADGVDADTWQYHRDRRDYSRWFDTSIKDAELAEEAGAIETGNAPADEARKLMREAIERRYAARVGCQLRREMPQAAVRKGRHSSHRADQVRLTFQKITKPSSTPLMSF